MSLFSDLLKRGRIDAPDFYLDLPSLPRCPRCGSNASVYIFNGTDLVCPPCRELSRRDSSASQLTRPGEISTSPCRTCGGTGEALEWRGAPDYEGPMPIDCPDCEGSGVANPPKDRQ